MAAHRSTRPDHLFEISHFDDPIDTVAFIQYTVGSVNQALSHYRKGTLCHSKQLNGTYLIATNWL